MTARTRGSLGYTLEPQHQVELDRVAFDCSSSKEPLVGRAFPIVPSADDGEPWPFERLAGPLGLAQESSLFLLGDLQSSGEGDRLLWRPPRDGQGLHTPDACRC